MRRVIPLLGLAVFLGLGSIAWGQCEADPNDRGECDTLYIEPWPDDVHLQGSPPYLVRVPLYVTCDLVDFLDSIRAFVIPLCYTHSNTSKYCSVSSWWNTTELFGPPEGDWADRTIFRHIIDGIDTLVHNRMMDLQYGFMGEEWDTRILELDGQVSHFWLSLFPTGTQDKSWWEGSRILLATMTFKLEDSTTICIDTCFWPPASRIEFTLSSGVESKIPRPGNSVHPDSFKTCFGFGANDVREVQSSEESTPSEFSLYQNYPNPFNPYTNFRFTLATSAHVKIEIYNIVGQRVRTLVDVDMKAGVYVADWDGKNDKGKSVSSGIYLYRMQAGDFTDMKKMLLLK